METRAKYAVIGIFTLAVIAAAFGFVWWFSGSRGGASRAAYRVVFTGPVSGLPRGGAVLFNGIRVGEVTDIDFNPEMPNRVFARIEIDPRVPMRTNTKAQLEYQGLTGVASIQLAGGDEEGKELVAREGEPLPTLTAESSEFQNLIATAQAIARKADAVLEKADRLLTDNESGIGKTVKNIETFTQALSDNADGVGNFMKQAGEVADRIGKLAGVAERLSGDLEALVKSVEPERVKKTLQNVESFTGALADKGDDIRTFLTDAAALAKRLNDSAGKLDKALDEVARVAAGLDTEKLGRTIDNVDKFATALGTNSEGFGRTLKNAEELSGKLNASADRLDSILRSADNLLGSDDGKGLVTEVSEAARSIRALAVNLDKRTAELSANLNRFTGPGLRDVETLAADGRRTLGELNRVLRNLERNPQQFIFGGRPGMPEYNGRR